MTDFVKNVFLSLSFLLIFAISQARAQGFFVEPYWGQEKSDFKQNSNSSNTTSKYFGFRIGGFANPFFFGFDVAKAKLDVNASDDDHLEAHDIGFLLGYRYTSFRLWFNYMFDSEADSENANGTYAGDGGYKVGVSYNLWSSLHLNLEKTVRNYSELDGDSLNSDIEVDGYFYSLSWLFAF